jgi:uncharacterized protein (DUF433 family)
MGTAAEPPLVQTHVRGRRPLLSFKNLVECYALEVIREAHRINVRTIRYSLHTALSKYPSKHPFADYDLSTKNGRIYLDDRVLVDLSIGGQIVFREFFGSSLRRVQRSEKGIAERLYPYMRKVQIADTKTDQSIVVVIDPAISFGMPVLVNSRISTALLASRYRGGDSISALAKDYGRKAGEIEEALTWERAKTAA